jgi:hypothetical protein
MLFLACLTLALLFAGHVLLLITLVCTTTRVGAAASLGQVC